ncbi:hypothetical protein HDV57DRAFT_491469 [Trichoderma longibrachiatum]
MERRVHIALVLDYCRFAAISLLSSTDKQDVPLIFFFGCYPSLGRRLLARLLIFMCLALTNARSAWKLYIHVRMHKAYVCMYVWHEHEHEQSRWAWTCCRYDQCVACLQGSANIHALPCLALLQRRHVASASYACMDEAVGIYSVREFSARKHALHIPVLFLLLSPLGFPSICFLSTYYLTCCGPRQLTPNVRVSLHPRKKCEWALSGPDVDWP